MPSASPSAASPARREQHVQRRVVAVAHARDRVLEQRAAHGVATGASRRGTRDRRERDRREELRIVAASVPPVRFGPAPVEHVFAVAVPLRVERQRADQRAFAPRGQVARRPAGARRRAAAVVQRVQERVREERLPARPARSTRRARSLPAARPRGSPARPRPASAAGRREREHAWRSRILAGMAPAAQAACVGVQPDAKACGADARIDQCNSLLRSSISGSATSPPTRAESWPPWRRRNAPARRSSSRPSCRCAAIRRKTCCCARRSSTRARASSPRSPAR